MVTLVTNYTLLENFTYAFYQFRIFPKAVFLHHTIRTLNEVQRNHKKELQNRKLQNEGENAPCTLQNQLKIRHCI